MLVDPNGEFSQAVGQCVFNPKANPMDLFVVFCVLPKLALIFPLGFTEGSGVR